MKNWLRNFFSSKWFKILLAIVVLGVAAFLFQVNNKNTEVTYVVGERAVEQVVLLSGSVRAVGQVNLSFSTAGKVAVTAVSSGDMVEEGQILAELDHKILEADLLQAEGRVQSARFNVSLAEASVLKAEANLASVRAQNRGTDSSITAAETVLVNTTFEQATLVKNAHSDLLNNDLVAYPVDNHRNVTAPVVSGNYSAETTGQYNLDFYKSGGKTGYSIKVSGLSDTTVSFDDYGIPTPLGRAGLYLTLPESGEGQMYGSTDWVIPVPNNRSTSYQTKLGAYNKALQTQASVVAAAKSNLDKLTSQQDSGSGMAITLAEEQRATAALAEARANLGQALGALTQAEAGTAKVLAQIESNIIRAPFSGTMARFDFKLGQSVSPGEAGMTIITDGDYELVMSIPEIDIAKVKIGDSADIILDTYGTDVVWAGVLSEIELIETKIDGVPSYASIITVPEPDSRIKIGMNARAKIVVDKKAGVIAIPTSYIKTENGVSTVLVKVSDRQSEERVISTGLTGTDFFVEVTAGLVKGETLIAATN